MPLLTGHDTPVAPSVDAVGTGPHLQADITCQRPDLVSALTLLCTRDTPYPPFAAAADNR